MRSQQHQYRYDTDVVTTTVATGGRPINPAPDTTS
jgi:hypothetical protein